MPGAFSNSPVNEELTGANDVSPIEVAKLLVGRGVRIVFLDVCEFASEQGPLSSTTRDIVETGVWMAIGMRYELLESAAEIFTQNLYRSS